MSTDYYVIPQNNNENWLFQINESNHKNQSIVFFNLHTSKKFITNNRLYYRDIKLLFSTNLKIANEMKWNEKRMRCVYDNDDDIICRRTFNTLSIFFCTYLLCISIFHLRKGKMSQSPFRRVIVKTFQYFIIIIMKRHTNNSASIKFRLSFSQKKKKKKKKTNNNYAHINISFHTQ